VVAPGGLAGEDLDPGWDQHGGSTNAFLQPIVAAVL
jgi:hypothetical protein